jgi:hypothetical protein
MRAILDQLRDRQSTPVWSRSKDKAYPPAPYVEDEEEDQVVSRPDSANDGGYDNGHEENDADEEERRHKEDCREKKDGRNEENGLNKGLRSGD